MRYYQHPLICMASVLQIFITEIHYYLWTICLFVCLSARSSHGVWYCHCLSFGYNHAWMINLISLNLLIPHTDAWQFLWQFSYIICMWTAIGTAEYLWSICVDITCKHHYPKTFTLFYSRNNNNVCGCNRLHLSHEKVFYLLSYHSGNNHAKEIKRL